MQHQADLESKLDKERRDRNKAMSDLQNKIEDEQDRMEAKFLQDIQLVKDDAEVKRHLFELKLQTRWAGRSIGGLNIQIIYIFA